MEAKEAKEASRWCQEWYSLIDPISRCIQCVGVPGIQELTNGGKDVYDLRQSNSQSAYKIIRSRGDGNRC